MRLRRRQFLKYCLGSAAALSLPSGILGRLEQALAAGVARLPQVIWLNGANCTGCTVSLANRIGAQAPVDVADLLLNFIDLSFHPNLMGAAGELAVERLLETAAAGNYILAVDGGIPTAFGGHSCVLWTENGREVTAMEAVGRLAPGAAAVLAVGTCASWGGVSAAAPNPTGVKGLGEFLGAKTINIPGCPAHPDWIVWTVAHLLAGTIPALDGRGRPAALYDPEVSIHKICPRKGREKATTFGEPNLCLKEIGCRGPQTHADCPVRRWNNAAGWCIGANAVCIGCTEQGFPDKFSPFYKVEYAYQPYEKPADPPPDPEPDPGGGDNPTAGDGQLRFTKAEWVAEKKELRAEGRAAAGAAVVLKDAATRSTMGVTAADDDGKWRFRIKAPASVPLSLLAEAGGAAVFCDVKGAPGAGPIGPAEGDGALQLERAEWRADKSELKVEGRGRPGGQVAVTNARTGQLIGRTSVKDDGKWKLLRRAPSAVPCRVRATLGTQSAESGVRNAPGSCI